ncbi:hypothetical protein MASR1M60_18720 [Rhodocyclaceae bacterium]
MKKAALALLWFCLLPALAQERPRPVPPYEQTHERQARGEATVESRRQWHEERRQRREALQQMSPEDRHQLRRDIRDAGRTLYLRGPQQRED